ncbi:MAG: hypothetical protein QOH25_2436 [Acidobacteriota bacterium]|jgi:hypothetical protein|nr:hypothetical protein [Acidobacteriota bacterium]
MLQVHRPEERASEHAREHNIKSLRGESSGANFYHHTISRVSGVMNLARPFKAGTRLALNRARRVSDG